MQQIKKGDIVTATYCPDRTLIVTKILKYDSGLPVLEGVLLYTHEQKYAIVRSAGELTKGSIRGYQLSTKKLIPFKQGDIVKGRQHIVLVSEDQKTIEDSFSGTVIDHTREKGKILPLPKGSHNGCWRAEDFRIARYVTPCVFKPGDIVIENVKKPLDTKLKLKVVVIGPGADSDHFTGMVIETDCKVYGVGEINNDWINSRFNIYKEPKNIPTPALKSKVSEWPAEWIDEEDKDNKPLPKKNKPKPPLSSVEPTEWPDDDNTPRVETAVDPFIPGATFMHVFKESNKVVVTGPGKTPATFSGVRLLDGRYSSDYARKYFKPIPTKTFKPGAVVKYYNMVIKVTGPGKNPQTFTGVVTVGGTLPVGTYSEIWFISEAKEVTNEDI